MRQCSKTSCQTAAVATLTYNYADSTVVLGPMSRLAEPHTYDLCARHSHSMTAPKGWELLRIAPPEGSAPAARPEPDDLLALAHAVREPSPRAEADRPASGTGSRTAPPTTGRRGTAPDAGPRPEANGSAGSINGEAPARPGRPTLRVLRDTGDR
ncbi:DUF3499 domain-containing protein [Citricoccus nitrophenolicus]|uniref:DUF3499 domain-containing protein n=1 Tax=Citricoccus nitrophenolicus TaxID=863575 RepID=A0ABV0IJU0_9MICC